MNSLNTFVTSSGRTWGQGFDGATVADGASFSAAVATLRSLAASDPRLQAATASFERLLNVTSVAPDGLSLDRTVFALRDAGIEPLLGAPPPALRLVALPLRAAIGLSWRRLPLPPPLRDAHPQSSRLAAGHSRSRRSTDRSPRTGRSAGACGRAKSGPVSLLLLTWNALLA